jgi:DNA-binding NarL/FixJ family response regulator
MHPHPRPNPLTPRERTILDLLGKGLDHRAVASRLRLAPATVSQYVNRLRRKLRLRSASDVRHLAIQLQLP